MQIFASVPVLGDSGVDDLIIISHQDYLAAQSKPAGYLEEGTNRQR